MDPELLKLVGGGGTFVALLYLVYLVGMRLVAAIDRVGTKVDSMGEKFDAHTKIDVAHHNDVSEKIVRVEAKLDGRMTPVQGVPIAFSPRAATQDGK